MTDTPRTDAVSFDLYGEYVAIKTVVDVELARQLEREIADLKRDRDRYERCLRDIAGAIGGFIPCEGGEKETPRAWAQAELSRKPVKTNPKP